MDIYVTILFIVFFTGALLCQLALWFIRRYRKKTSSLSPCPSSGNEREDRYLHLHHAIDVVSIAFLWYSISLSFTIFNKWFMQEFRGGFNFPIFITTMHMFVKCVISVVWRTSPTIDKIEPLSWHTLLMVVIPIGALTAGDIVMTNSAILFLPLSLVTTIKGSSLIFTFLWGVFLQIEKFQWRLFFAVAGISTGLSFAVSNASGFSFLGVLLSVGASAAGGLRWALMQFLEVKDTQSKSVMVTLYRFSPASFLSIFPVFLTFELSKLAKSEFAKRTKSFDDAVLLCAFGGFISFLLIIVEVKLMRLTSSLTMSVFGQMKEIIQIVLAMIIFKENLTLKCVIGIAISILGSCYYRYIIVNRDEDGGNYAAVAEDEEESKHGGLRTIQSPILVESRTNAHINNTNSEIKTKQIELKPMKFGLMDAADR